LKDFKSLLRVVMTCLPSLTERGKCQMKRIEFTTKDSEYFKECANIFLAKIS